MTSCPECGYPQRCGCSVYCTSKVPEGIKPYTWTDDGEGRRCANCGYTQSEDGWLTIYEQQVKEGKIK